ncbi:MAG TPA: dihydropyrimidinase [Candidatus Limnocylindrales bacterium]|nr:dihydropyrimidinase [Candidatus Limnocylindrales bacterium]
MAAIDLIVSGGTVVMATGRQEADVAIAAGRIETIGPGLAAEGARIVDATGMLVLPGVIDVHTHLRLPDAEHPDRFRQDTTAAAHGGTTTVLTFNNPGTGISDRGSSSLLAGLEEFRARTAGESPIDYGLCAVITGRQQDPIGELPALIEAGVPTFKAFMVYDFRLPDDALHDAMRTAARHGGMLQVHCEEPAIIDPLVADALRRGDTACRYHALTRPSRAEGAATRRAIEMAHRADAPLYIVHLSCDEALEAVAEAKQRGQPVYAETCPHYLTFTDAVYGESDEAEVIKRVISPPLRTQADVDALWTGLRDGVLDVVGSDHVPDRLDTEKRVPAPPFPEISNGGPGIETLMAVVYSEGVARGRITIERMTEVLATAPARIFGLPSKGAIEVGRDADLVIWDPAVDRALGQADLHHTSDYTPYEGMAVRGAIADVIVRGLAMGESSGRFLERRLA